MSALLYGIVAIVVAVLIYYAKSSKYSKYPPMPPGRLPIVGHMLAFPPTYPGHVTRKWAKDLNSEMMTVQLGNTTWVFLNSSRVVKDIIEKRSAITSGRPRFPVTQDGISRGNRVVLMSYTPTWRAIRKIMHNILMAKQANTYKPYQDMESKQLLYEYLHEPDDYYLHNGRFANSVIMSVVFGRRSKNDQNTKDLFHTIDMFLGVQLNPAANIPTLFPFLGDLPQALQWWAKQSDKDYKFTVDVYKRCFDEMQQRQTEGKQAECFAQELSGADDLSDVQKFFVAGTLLEAGSDTTRNATNVALAAMATDPSWLPKVRAQMDEVCGDAQRLPGFEDWQKLTYIHAVVKEVNR